jgi:tetratricopeptide (TPR) repeat protein
MAKQIKQNRIYTAEDGLNVLGYLGITAVTDEEKKVFREKWDECYKARDGNLIMTTWTLYAEALPYICGDKNNERGMFALAQLRDSDFGKRLDNTKVTEKFKKGIPLEEILGHTIKTQINRKAAEQALFDAKLAVIEVKKTGGDITTLRDYLRLSKRAIEVKYYSDAIKHANRAKEEAQKQKTLYEETFEAMSEAANGIAMAKKCNIDATKAIERLLAARTAFEKCEYEKASEYAKECRDIAHNINEKYKTAQLCITIDKEITLAIKCRLNTKKAKTLFDNAVQLLKTGNYDASLVQAKKAEEYIVTSLENYLATEFKAIEESRRNWTQFKKQQKYEPKPAPEFDLDKPETWHEPMTPDKDLENRVKCLEEARQIVEQARNSALQGYIQLHLNDPDVKNLLEKARKAKK